MTCLVSVALVRCSGYVCEAMYVVMQAALRSISADLNVTDHSFHNVPTPKRIEKLIGRSTSPTLPGVGQM